MHLYNIGICIYPTTYYIIIDLKCTLFKCVILTINNCIDICRLITT